MNRVQARRERRAQLKRQKERNQPVRVLGPLVIQGDDIKLRPLWQLSRSEQKRLYRAQRKLRRMGVY
jgi:hypothetical protein